MFLLFFLFAASVLHAAPIVFEQIGAAYTATTLSCNTGTVAITYTRVSYNGSRIVTGCVSSGYPGYGMHVLTRTSPTSYALSPQVLLGTNGTMNQTFTNNFDISANGTVLVSACESLVRFQLLVNGSWVQQGPLFNDPVYAFGCSAQTGYTPSFALSSDGTFVISLMFANVGNAWTISMYTWTGTTWVFTSTFNTFPALYPNPVTSDVINHAFNLAISQDMSTLVFGFCSASIADYGYVTVIKQDTQGNWTDTQVFNYTETTLSWIQGANVQVSSDGSRVAYTAMSGVDVSYTFVYDQAENGTYMFTYLNETVGLLTMNGNGNLMIGAISTDVTETIWSLTPTDTPTWLLSNTSIANVFPYPYSRLSNDGGILGIVDDGKRSFTIYGTVDTLAPTPYPSLSPTFAPHPLELAPLDVSNIRLGNTQNFTLALSTDATYPSPYAIRNPDGTYSPYLWVSFVSPTQGTYGFLSTWNGSACTSTPVLENIAYGPSTPTNFTFCYVSNGSLVDEWGNDTFQAVATKSVFDVFRFNISSSVEPLVMEVIDPLQGCAFSTEIYSPTYAESPCVALTSMTLSNLNFTVLPLWLQGSDSLVPPRTWNYVFVSLPLNGTLYLDAGLTVPIVDTTTYTISGSLPAPNLYYKSQLNYFNRWGTDQYVNPLNVSWNNCSLSSAPGCPDSFVYQLLADDNNTSPDSTMSIYVQGIFTFLYPTTLPFLPITIHANIRFYFNETGYEMVLYDPNQDMFMVGISFQTSSGLLGFDITPDQARQFGVSFLYCPDPEFGCNDVRFYGYPSLLNTLFPHMYLFSTTTFTSATWTISIFKPAPQGVTTANANSVLVFGTPLNKTILTFSSITNTQAPTVNPESASDFLASLVSAIVLAVLAVCFCGVVTFYTLGRTVLGRAETYAQQNKLFE